MARINQACSDASYLKTALACMLVFLGIMFVPIVGWVGMGGFYFLLLAIPVWAIRWWFRFWKIKTDDGDFRRAKRTMVLIGTPVAGLLFYDLLRFALYLFH